MRFLYLTEEQLEKHRKAIVDFIRYHGEKRITHQAIKWVTEMSTEDLKRPGTAVIVAVEGKVLCGMIAVSNYGIDESIVIVHRNYRQQNIGIQLINHLLAVIDKLYGRVSLDNIPSLKMCFAIGMVGFKLIEGPTGKPTMWMGIGNWNKEDIA